MNSYVKSILILSSHLCLGLPSDLFPSGFPTKTLYMSLLSPPPYAPHAPPISFPLISQIIFSEEYRLLSSLLCSFFPLPCYLIPLRPKYSPQHPVFIHPQPMFLPQCQRPSFTSILNNRQNYSSIYLDL